MGNIHFGRGFFDKKKDSITLEVYCHVDVSGTNYPGSQTHKAPNMSTEERAAHEAGAIYEEIKTFRLPRASKAAVKGKIAAMWPQIEDKIKKQVTVEYALYGETI